MHRMSELRPDTWMKSPPSITILASHRHCWPAPRHAGCMLQSPQRSERQSCWMSQSKGRGERSKSITVAVPKDQTVRTMRLFWGCSRNQAGHGVNQDICYPDICCKSNGGLRQQFCSLLECRWANSLLQAMEEGTGEKFF